MGPLGGPGEAPSLCQMSPFRVTLGGVCSPPWRACLPPLLGQDSQPFLPCEDRRVEGAQLLPALNPLFARGETETRRGGAHPPGLRRGHQIGRAHV